MYVTVYRVRDRGVRLPSPKSGVGGYLELGPWRDGYEKPLLRARLVLQPGTADSLLPDLYFAHVRRITGNGLHLVGLEVIARRANNKASADRYRQTWWCLVHTEDGKLALEDLENPLTLPGTH
ncbi:hypothetical protein [Ramlibacter sp.]|uniref:hypothetical protein n=1 Tax=Ramlibacter sp. TaxID=1917967 RepID=UPI003D0B81C6